VDDRIDPCLKDQTLQIAQVAGHYYTVQKYVEKACNFDYGKVNHALAAAMKILLREYHTLLGQLESIYAKVLYYSHWFG
jgi:gamma-tubulin complex component 2